jgi:DNA topoisomerase III
LELGILKRGRRLKASWEAGRSFNKNKTEALVTTAVETNSVVTVTNVVTKDKIQGRPIPLNTVGMLKACSKALGIGPHATMQAAERLYLMGYLSYPRTESSAYPKSFDIAGTLQQQASDGRWGPYVRELLKQGHNKSRGGVDMGDHPPITPCRPAGPHELSGDMARIFDLVVRHFIASVSEDAVWQSTKISFVIEALGDKGKFFVAGKQVSVYCSLFLC